jgi:hypothetical protein
MRQTWEYIVVDACNDSGHMQNALNQYEIQGWEYVGRSGDYTFSTRPK